MMEESGPDDSFVTVVCPTCRARLSPAPRIDWQVALLSRLRRGRAGHRAGGGRSACLRDPTGHEYRLGGDEQPREQPKTVLAVCGVCGARLFPRVELIGKRVRCPDCFKPVLVQAAAPRSDAEGKARRGRISSGRRTGFKSAGGSDLDGAAAAPSLEPEPLPPAAPRWWFYSGVFSFPWNPGTVSRWFVLTMLALFSNGVTAYGISLAPELAGASGPMAGYGVGMKVASTIALGAIVWLLMMSFACGCAVAVIRDTAAGNDEVADWSDAEFYEGMWRIPYIVFPLVTAGAGAYAVFFVLANILPDSWPPALRVAEAAGDVTVVLLYPAMLISVIEQGVVWNVFSPTAFRLILGYWRGWLLVIALIGLISGTWWALTVWGVGWSLWPTVIVGALAVCGHRADQRPAAGPISLSSPRGGRPGATGRRRRGRRQRRTVSATRHAVAAARLRFLARRFSHGHFRECHFVQAEIRDRIDHDVGAIGVALQILAARATGEYQNGAIAELNPAQNVGFHGVADHGHFFGTQAQFLAGCAHHDGAGLADAESFDAGGGFEHGDNRPTAGAQAVLGGTIGIEVRGHQLRAGDDHLHCGLDRFHRHGSPFADNDVVGVMIDDRITVRVQSVQQPPFADDVGCSPRLLLRQKPGRGHGASEDVLLFRVDAHAAQLGGHIAARALTVIGEKEKRDLLRD